jgi:hypothetical protein
MPPAAAPHSCSLFNYVFEGFVRPLGWYMNTMWKVIWGIRLELGYLFQVCLFLV